MNQAYLSQAVAVALKSAKRNDKVVYLHPTAYGLKARFDKPHSTQNYYYARPNGELVWSEREIGAQTRTEKVQSYRFA